MKTKKEIFQWWKSLGEKTEFNDYKDFWNKIDKEKISIIEKQEGNGEKQTHVLTLMKPSWKYPLRLYFFNLECYKISEF